MSIELLAKQGRDRVHGGLAAIDSAKLRQLRDQGMRNCFTRLEETANRMEHVARIYGKEFINDAAARSINATYYTLQNTEGNITWIVFSDDPTAEYERLSSLVASKVTSIICIGNSISTNLFRKEFGKYTPLIYDARSIAHAVQIALYNAPDNCKVIFSPATPIGPSSEEAGRIFRHEVNEL